MSHLYVSDEIKNMISIGGIAAGGLAGSQQIPRATLIRGIVKVYHFQFEQATPNPMPGTPTTTFASGDAVVIALMKPTDRLYAGIWAANAWGGTNTVIGFGKIDPNNSANTNNTFFQAPVSIVSAVTWFSLAGFFNLDLCAQVGADPQGDQSVGNQIPEFGSADIMITATVASDALGTGGVVEGYLLVVEEGN